MAGNQEITVRAEFLAHILPIDIGRWARRFQALFSRKTACAVFLLSAMSGCVTTAPTIPIAVSCVKEAPAMPLTATEAEILAMSDYAATLHTYTERLLLKAYALKASAVIDGCR